MKRMIRKSIVLSFICCIGTLIGGCASSGGEGTPQAAPEALSQNADDTGNQQDARVKRPSRAISDDNQTVFKRDPVLKLVASCKTGNIAGCRRLKELRTMITTAQKLHRAQMNTWEPKLRLLSKLLQRKESKPIIRLTEVPFDIKRWSNPDAELSAMIEVRMETPRGMERLPNGTEQEIKVKVEELSTFFEESDEAWRSLLADFPQGIPLGEKVNQERQFIQFSVKSKKVDDRFKAPLHLLKKYMTRTVSPWGAKVAHVRTTAAHKYTLVQEHRLAIDAPFTVSVSAKGGSLTEARASRKTVNFTSVISPEAVCSSLRGEVRLKRTGAESRMSLAITNKKAGGVK
jgi:hypothetical protein